MTEELRPLHLGVTPFRYLAGARSMLDWTLSASGFSRSVVARGPFQTVTLRREPEASAFTARTNASGLFELEPDNGMLLPFGGMGVDTVWRLELPKPANPFDFRTVTDVLLTLEYTALGDPKNRHQVIPPLDRRYSADRSFSVQADFRDTWYDLNNPDTARIRPRRIRAVLSLTRDDFPPNIADLSLAQLTLFAVRADSVTEEVVVTAPPGTLNG